MLGHYALTLYRSLTRHKLYAAINVLGLAVGIAVFLVLALDVSFEASFERWIPDASKIYVVRQTWKFPGHSAEAFNSTMGGLLEELQADFPGEVTGTRIRDRGATVRQRGRVISEQAEMVDPGFFKVFDLPLTRGDKRTALAPDQVLLSETRARTYFGTTDVVGQRLTMSIEGNLRDYKVSGVFKDLPKNTELKFDIVTPLVSHTAKEAEEDNWYHWGSAHLATYLRLENPAAAEALNRRLDAFTDRRAQKDMNMPDAHRQLTLRLVPFTSVHLIDPKDRGVLGLLGAVGVLTLLLAAVNYVNLATARAGLRAREVAVRKVMGATGPGLVGQFMTEAVATASLAALVGLALTELSLPLVNAAGGLALKLDYLGADSVLPFVLGVVLVVGLGAGAYPALLLSRYRPAAVLASARTPGGGRAGSRVREMLVGAQFAIAIAFGVGTAVILAQGAHLRHADLGFRRDGLIEVKSFDDGDVSRAQQATLVELWRALPGVVGVTTANIAPGVDDNTNATNIKRPAVPGDGPSMNYVETGPDFFKVYGARLLAGRVLDRDHGMDDLPPTPDSATPEEKAAARQRNRNIVLNESALVLQHFGSPQDAIGKTLLEGTDGGGFRPTTVVGVVADLRLRSPRKAVPATFYELRTHGFSDAVSVIRYSGADPRAITERVQAAWRQVVPGVPFRAGTAERGLEIYYKPDDQRGRLFTVGALLAMAIGCVGLYGLAAFSTARRVKEIGIRKTLGASTRDILVLLLRQFVTPVLWANVAAWPLAYVAMRAWLSGFDQRIALGPQYFVGVSLVAIFVAAATVAAQAWRVARAEPARALRHE